MIKNRRQTVRVPVSMKVINESRESNFGFAYAKNISSGGMALQTEVLIDKEIDLKPGSTIRLKFKIPGGRLYITAQGEVTRVDKIGEETLNVGMRFVSLEKDFAKEIDDFVKQTEQGNLSLE